MQNPDPELQKLLDRLDAMSEKDRQAVIGLLPETTARRLDELTTKTLDEEVTDEAEEADARYAQYSPLLRRRINSAEAIKGRGFVVGYRVTEKAHATLIDIVTEEENAREDLERLKPESGASLVQKITEFLFPKAKQP